MVMQAARIVMVEDDPELRETLRAVLETEGFEVACARNGEEGLRCLDEGARPAAILVDLVMPAMGGREFLTTLRQDERFRTTPVVVMTGWARDEGQVNERIQGFFMKPVDPAALVATVRRIAAGRAEAVAQA